MYDFELPLKMCMMCAMIHKVVMFERMMSCSLVDELDELDAPAATERKWNE